jgi:hypothetical protein
MTNKEEKRGPQLLRIDDDFFRQIDSIRLLLKTEGHTDAAHFVDSVKAALSKHQAMAEYAKKISGAGNDATAAIKKFVDLVDQVWP